MKKELIYIACPYLHKNPDIIEFRYKTVTKFCAYLVSKGEYGAFSPLTHSHPLVDYFPLPKSWDFWKKADTVFLSYAKKIIVLTLDGWKESQGVQAEIEIAKNFGIPIEYVDPLNYLYDN